VFAYNLPEYAGKQIPTKTIAEIKIFIVFTGSISVHWKRSCE